MLVRIELDGEPFEVDIRRTPEGLRLTCDGEEFPAEARLSSGAVEVLLGRERLAVSFPVPGTAEVGGRRHSFDVIGFQPGGEGGSQADGARVPVRAQMPGRLVKVLVAPGAAVEKGSPLFVLEAMKMQNELTSPVAGRVAAIVASPGDVVGSGKVLAEIEPGHKS